MFVNRRISGSGLDFVVEPLGSKKEAAVSSQKTHVLYVRINTVLGSQTKTKKLEKRV